MTSRQIDMFGAPYVPGIARGTLQRGLASEPGPHIDIVMQDEIEAIREDTSGLIIIDGAPLSHSMIRILGLGVPAVIVSQQQATLLTEGQEVVIDGWRGYITSDLTQADKETVSAMSTEDNQPCMTTDGVRVHLHASVRNKESARQALLFGAEAIGLVRTEFFIPQHEQAPDAHYYQQVFTDLCQAATPLTVTFRLLDVSADKMPAWLTISEAGGGVLGMQGARLFSLPPVRTVLQAQLSVIEQLSKQFKLRVLIPYLVRYEEACYWVDQVRRYIPESIPVGAMVETPASALDVSYWFDCADFIAIGCNDLMQCLFAADRDQASLRNYLDPYAPLLFRLFRQVAQQAHQHLPQIQLCGVLSQLPGILPVLLGLGYRTFSVEAALIPHLAQEVKNTNIQQAQILADHICAALTSQQVLELLGLPDEYHRTFIAPQ